MTRQTQGSIFAVGAIAGGAGFVAFVALMVVGGFAFSPALFLAIVVAAAAAIVLFLGLHDRGGAGSRDAARPMPTAASDGRLGDRTVAPGTAGVTPGTAGVATEAGVAPGSAGAPSEPIPVTGVDTDGSRSSSDADRPASDGNAPARIDTGTTQARPGGPDADTPDGEGAAPGPDAPESGEPDAGGDYEAASPTAVAPSLSADRDRATEGEAIAGEPGSEGHGAPSAGDDAEEGAFEDAEKARMDAAQEEIAAETAAADPVAVPPTEDAPKWRSSQLSGERELAERKGEWRYERPAEGTSGAESSIRASDADMPTDEGTAGGLTPAGTPIEAADAPQPGDDIVPAGDDDRETVAAGEPGNGAKTDAQAAGDDGTVRIGTEPLRLSEPREGGADDLKRVKGVGPKLEQMLHRMGFFHFDQLAAWSEGEVAWVDENLEGFKGRVSRDNWVAQARVLAEGGQTEFSRRVGEGEVY